MASHILPVAGMLILGVGATLSVAHAGNTGALQFHRIYAYDARDPAVFHDRNTEYDVSIDLSFRADGSGISTDEGTSRFRWHAAASSRETVVMIGDYVDARDPDGNPIQPAPLSLTPIRVSVSTDGRRLNDRSTAGSNIGCGRILPNPDPVQQRAVA
ncbi:MAG TPA: hypothetical protein VF265_08680 [Nevskiaceae bacterium]